MADVASQKHESRWRCPRETAHMAHSVSGSIEQEEGSIAEEVMGGESADTESGFLERYLTD